MSKDLRGISRKPIQAGQDWGDPMTWYGLILSLVLIGGGVYAGLTHEPQYTWNNYKEEQWKKN